MHTGFLYLLLFVAVIYLIGDVAFRVFDIIVEHHHAEIAAINKDAEKKK
jgi:Na+-transporting methylmalonyl-CoA/oxaloacetate decarboxylase gamma subunit